MSTNDDWPAKVTSTLVGYVDRVRGATTGKALGASRVAVYFLAIGLTAIVALVISLILVVRLAVVVSAYLPFVDDGESWFAYLVLGIAFWAIGGFLWKKKGA